MPAMRPDGILPGPCPVVNNVPSCPPPTEIVCIDVDMVYDFCIQSDFQFECFDIPAACGSPPFPADTTIECNLGTITCLEIPPRIPAIGFPAGFSNVTVQITVPATVTIRNPDGTVRCTFTHTVRFIKILLLYAPSGTRINCQIIAASCREPRVADDPQICVKIELCTIIQALALVKLLVPSYGFCHPAECIPAAQDEFPCPPGDLFPPQTQSTLVTQIERGLVPINHSSFGNATGINRLAKSFPPVKKKEKRKVDNNKADGNLVTASTGELVFNPGFEDGFGIDGVPNGWEGTNVARQNAQEKIHSGFRAVLLGASSTKNASLSQANDDPNVILPGCQYMLSFFAGGSLASGATFTGSLLFLDDSGGTIGRTDITVHDQSITTNVGKYYYAITPTAPADLAGILILFEKNGVGQVTLDDVSVSIL